MADMTDALRRRLMTTVHPADYAANALARRPEWQQRCAEAWRTQYRNVVHGERVWRYGVSQFVRVSNGGQRTLRTTTVTPADEEPR